MDYESKILLNRLVDEVEKLNSPDWWVIGITVVNALIVAWLAWRQYQLQKQQVKFQEYEIYKELYLFVKDIYDISNSFLSDICRIFSDKFYKDNELDSLKNIANNLNKLFAKYEKYNKEIELKTNITSLQMMNYYLLLDEMYVILFDLKEGIEKGHIIKEERNNRIKYDESVNYILGIVDEPLKQKIQKNLLSFNKTLNRVRSYKILETLKKHCVL